MPKAMRRLLALAAVLLGLSAAPAYAYPAGLDETRWFILSRVCANKKPSIS